MNDTKLNGRRTRNDFLQNAEKNPLAANLRIIGWNKTLYSFAVNIGIIVIKFVIKKP